VNELFSAAPSLLLTVVVGYLLGALPLADQISRRHGVDIFSRGTGLAGSTNVRKSVGNFPGLMVLIGDVSKGALAVIFAKAIGVEGPWVLLCAGAAVVGHWASIFSGLRGGDGIATLGGATIALFPMPGLIGVVVGALVQFGGQRMPYSSLMGVVFAYATLAALSLAYDGDAALVLGLGGLAGLVLARTLLGHRRRRRVSEWDEVEDSEGITERSG
jgi:glycerol-3-phosphate acyltransferase PlsY